MGSWCACVCVSSVCFPFLFNFDGDIRYSLSLTHKHKHIRRERIEQIIQFRADHFISRFTVCRFDAFTRNGREMRVTIDTDIWPERFDTENFTFVNRARCANKFIRCAHGVQTAMHAINHQCLLCGLTLLHSVAFMCHVRCRLYLPLFPEQMDP